MGNVKRLYNFIIDNVDVGKVVSNLNKVQLKEDIFDDNPEFKKELEFLIDKWSQFLSSEDAVIQAAEIFNLPQDTAKTLVSEVADFLGVIEPIDQDIGEKKVKAAFKEVKKDEPKIVDKTRKKEGEEVAKKQKVAIALSKARRAGARISKNPNESIKEEKDTDSSLVNDIVQRGFFKDIHFFKCEDLAEIDIDSIVDSIIDDFGFNLGNTALSILSGRDFREQNLGDLEIIQKKLKGNLAKQLKDFIEGNITRAKGEIEHDKE